MSNYSVTRWREICSPNAATLRFRLTGEGFQVSQWTDQPNAIYGWKKSPLERTHWVISGSLKITIKDVGIFTLNAGDRDFIPVETYYRAETVGEEPVMYLVGERTKPIIRKKRGRKRKPTELEEILKDFSRG